MIAPGVAVTLVSLVVGWVALFPLRRALGSWGFHLAATPAGFAGWALVASVTSLTGLRYTPLSIGIGLAVYAAAVAGGGILLARRYPSEAGAPPWWSYLVHAGLLAAFASIVAALGVSVYNSDSWHHLEPGGMILHDTGRMPWLLVDQRNVLLPSLLAANRFFGGDWTYVLQPVWAVYTAALTYWAIVRGLRRHGSAWVAFVVATVVVALMVTTASFLYHSVFAHSHMITALYLVLAVVGCLAADTSETEVRLSWFLVAGLAAAAVGLARPDGPIYVLVPLVVFAVVWSQHTERRAGNVAFIGTLLAYTALVLGPQLAHHGIWTSSKLSGTIVLAYLGGLALVGIALHALGGARSPLAGIDRAGAVRLLLAVQVVAVLVLVAARPDGFVLHTQNALANLLVEAGYHSLWTFAAIVVVVALAFPDVRTRDGAIILLVIAVLEYLLVASVLHGMTHPGRVIHQDSFARSAFQATPLVWLLAGRLTGAVIDGLRRPSPDAVAPDAAAPVAGDARERSA